MYIYSAHISKSIYIYIYYAHTQIMKFGYAIVLQYLNGFGPTQVRCAWTGNFFDHWFRFPMPITATKYLVIICLCVCLSFHSISFITHCHSSLRLALDHFMYFLDPETHIVPLPDLL